ncbi:hypothetical protein TD95_003955 [Thielaviopsis punctulata]|uniref:glucosamine-6-phosphate deaminase n=1 Tax=Thielaviopsis punctulata TaxID=72032 RepID=A0A0F4ZB00_9PEZI|nr:hypothetical protein TD95_003955 [Thielaviopsis punctulata]
MRLVIRDTAQDAGVWAANLVADRLRDSNPTPEKPFVLGLPTGSTPLPVYRELVRQYNAGLVSFANVVTFNMGKKQKDEYVGLPRDHPESYHSFMWTNLFSHIDINPANVHILNGNAPDLAAECAAYEAAIDAAGGIDLFLAGVGEDGHIAFNEPGSSLSSLTRVKTLTHDTILANARFFNGDVAQVPRQALTVGVATVMDAREVVCMAFGARKARALHKCIEGGISHMWTMSALQNHRRAIVLADDDATLDLRVGTVRYFKSIEAEADAEAVRLAAVQAQLARLANPSAAESPDSPQSQSQPVLTPLSTSYAPTPIVIEASSPVTYEPVAVAMPQQGLLGADVGTAAVPRTPSPDLVMDSMSSRIPAVPEVNTATPDLVPDRMASRLPDPAPFLRRLTPNPEAQLRRVGGVGA